MLNQVTREIPLEASRHEMFEQNFALVRLVHRLEEEAAATNVMPEDSRTALLLVEQAAKALDGMLKAIDSYVETADRSFLRFARENDALVWSVRKSL